MNVNNIWLAAETNITTVSYQWGKYGRSMYVHILARPQTKNEDSELSFDVVKTMVYS